MRYRGAVGQWRKIATRWHLPPEGARRWKRFHLDAMRDIRSALRHFPWKPVPWALGLAIVVTGATCVPVDRDGDPRGALVAALSRDGYVASVEDVHFFGPPSTLGTTRGVVRAWKRGEPADIFHFRVKMTSAGAVLGAPALYNLTATPADEGPIEVVGQRVAFTVRMMSGTIGVRVLDLRGEAPLEGDWSTIARWQNAVTNLQQTGLTTGVNSVFWAIDPPKDDVSLTLMLDGWIEMRSNGSIARMPTEGGRVVGDMTDLEYRPSTKGRPGNLVTWAVDRVRAMPWFGDDRMQMLKTVAFGVLDVYRRAQTTVMGDSSAEEIAEDLGGIVARNAPTTFTDPETGWPPAPIEPFLGKKMEGEGQWIPLENDPFIRMNPGVPPAFLTSFVRTDPKRSYTRIYVTLWDPRQVELHMMAGSVEPKGASGEAGPGMIPRRPELMKRLVAGINGGFQALHGEWGMMGDGVIYLPPKPFAATVAEMRDGFTGFGTWPNDPVVPPTIQSYRQNLTPLVMDEVINPYKRGWWGGTPPEWEDRVHTTRTGICLTKEGFIAYLYGNEIDVMPLAQAMVQARCQYGIHLDMNPGHTGLEYYKVAPTGTLPDLGRPLDKKWEAEGPVPFMEGWSFRARRMVRFMGLMNFPRYIQRETRDYFYLTLRSVLPGPELDIAEGVQAQWRTSGLPQHGFPYAIATTELQPDPSRADTKVFIMKLDPRTVRLASEADDKLVVSMANVEVEPNQPTLWISDRACAIASEPVNGAVAVVSGLEPGSLAGQEPVAALGIQDDDGMLVYIEIQQGKRPGADEAMLTSLLEKLGCSSRLLLSRPLAPSLGHPASGGGRKVHFVRVDAPGARRIFESTPVVDPSEWAPLQARRIRYFKKPKASGNE
jgi:hypothetical protein